MVLTNQLLEFCADKGHLLACSSGHSHSLSELTVIALALMVQLQVIKAILEVVQTATFLILPQKHSEQLLTRLLHHH